jgi:hypothetical protein
LSLNVESGRFFLVFLVSWVSFVVGVIVGGGVVVATSPFLCSYCGYSRSVEKKKN